LHLTLGVCSELKHWWEGLFAGIVCTKCMEAGAHRSFNDKAAHFKRSK